MGTRAPGVRSRIGPYFSLNQGVPAQSRYVGERPKVPRRPLRSGRGHRIERLWPSTLHIFGGSTFAIHNRWSERSGSVPGHGVFRAYLKIAPNLWIADKSPGMVHKRSRN